MFFYINNFNFFIFFLDCSNIFQGATNFNFTNPIPSMLSTTVGFYLKYSRSIMNGGTFKMGKTVMNTLIKNEYLNLIS